jgi:NADH-quinone oxidoreductase subunit J
MDWVLISFYAFATVAVVAAGAVISVRNPVHAVLCLILTFFSVACTWLLAEAEFLAVALVLVYVGAVMVLFLFVVMMLDIDIDAVARGLRACLPIGLLVAVVMLGRDAGADRRARDGQPGAGRRRPRRRHRTRPGWRRAVHQFLLPFEIAALILTVGIVPRRSLTLRQRTGIKAQDPAAPGARGGARPHPHREDAGREAGHVRPGAAAP